MLSKGIHEQELTCRRALAHATTSESGRLCRPSLLAGTPKGLAKPIPMLVCFISNTCIARTLPAARVKARTTAMPSQGSTQKGLQTMSANGREKVHDPYFVCIGSQKAGTDWIYDQFGSHKDFWRHPIKEVHYFDRGFGRARIAKAQRKLAWMTRHHAQGKGDFTHEISFLIRMSERTPPPSFPGDGVKPYRALFQNRPGLCFDCTPSYLSINLRIASEMYVQLPETYFIIAVREPVSRLWSQALMHDRLNPGDPVTTSLHDFKEFAHRPAVKSLSFLSRQIQGWLELDESDSRVGVFFFDDLKSDPKRYRDAMCNYLNVAPSSFTLDAGFNKKRSQSGKRAMPIEYENWALEYFTDERKVLADTLGGPALSWL